MFCRVTALIDFYDALFGTGIQILTLFITLVLTFTLTLALLTLQSGSRGAAQLSLPCVS